jgi:hypothetical protein
MEGRQLYDRMISDIRLAINARDVVRGRFQNFVTVRDINGSAVRQRNEMSIEEDMIHSTYTISFSEDLARLVRLVNKFAENGLPFHTDFVDVASCFAELLKNKDVVVCAFQKMIESSDVIPLGGKVPGTYSDLLNDHLAELHCDAEILDGLVHDLSQKRELLSSTVH